MGDSTETELPTSVTTQRDDADDELDDVSFVWYSDPESETPEDDPDETESESDSTVDDALEAKSELEDTIPEGLAESQQAVPKAPATEYQGALRQVRIADENELHEISKVPNTRLQNERDGFAEEVEELLQSGLGLVRQPNRHVTFQRLGKRCRDEFGADEWAGAAEIMSLADKIWKRANTYREHIQKQLDEE